MDVLLDSTVFWDDPNLKSEAWTLLKEYVRRSGCRVFVPAVVRHEIEAKFIERLEKERKDVASSSASISRLTEVSFQTPDIAVSAESKKYISRLDGRFYQLGARIFPASTICHESMVDRPPKA